MQVRRIDVENIHVGVDIAYQGHVAVLRDHGAVRLQLGHVTRQGCQLLLGAGEVQGGRVALADVVGWEPLWRRQGGVGVADAVHGRAAERAPARVQVAASNDGIDGVAWLFVRANVVVVQVDIAASGDAATDAGKAAGAAAADVAEDESRVAIGDAKVNHGGLGRRAEGESEQGGADERQGAGSK
ncbi:hypothetical protein D3C72_1719030 [compost metagenome]